VQRLPDDVQPAEIIPGADLWPRFVRNRSEQFEARFSLVEVQDSPSPSSPAWPAP
jgi:phosphoribosylformylglycinamidine (FGAM) synthase-like amidotransferase family enzyme